jgi:hypothetical protein
LLVEEHPVERDPCEPVTFTPLLAWYTASEENVTSSVPCRVTVPQISGSRLDPSPVKVIGAEAVPERVIVTDP